jgi:hypothetical protein
MKTVVNQRVIIKNAGYILNCWMILPVYCGRSVLSRRRKMAAKIKSHIETESKNLEVIRPMIKRKHDM